MNLKNVWRERLHGQIFPAVPVPMSSDGQIHRAGQEQYVRYMQKQPIGGVAVWAHTGRGLYLSHPQRQEVLSSWRQGLAGKIIIAGVGSLISGEGTFLQRNQRYQDASLAMGECALDLGADALLVYAPVLYRDHPNRDELILQYHKRLASLGLPLILFYLYEAAGGVSYSPQVLGELLSIPEVVGIKVATLDSVMTYQDIERLTRQYPEVQLITGEDRMLGYTMMRGGHSALIGMGAACPAPQVELLQSYLRGDMQRFARLSNLVDAFAEATFIPPMEGYIIRMLTALVLLGILPQEAAHDPLGYTCSDQEREVIRLAIQGLGEI